MEARVVNCDAHKNTMKIITQPFFPNDSKRGRVMKMKMVYILLVFSLAGSGLMLKMITKTVHAHEIVEEKEVLHDETGLTGEKTTYGGNDSASVEINAHSSQERAKEKKAGFVNNIAKELAAVTKPIDVPPDYVRCFEQVKSLLNSTTNNASFCEAPCVQELRYYLNKEGVAFSRFKPMKTDVSRPKQMKKYNITLPRSSFYVNSCGGVGSSFIMTALNKLHFRTNNRADHDDLKHQTPFSLFSYKKKGSTCNNTFSNQTQYDNKVRGKYDAVINVYGSPAHAIFSLYSRGYEESQYKKLNFPMGKCELPKTWHKNVTVLFDASAKAGSDVFGIEQYTHQWMNLQDIVTFGFRNKTLLTPELQAFRQPSNSRLNYAQGVVKDFPPIFITDIATTRAAPAVFAALLDITVDELEVIFASTENKQKTEPEKKLTQEQEHAIIKGAGAAQIYAMLEQEIQQRIKQNYLLFGVAMFCSVSSSNTL